MGARGNSGVILSQIVRGLCDVWGRSEDLTTADFKAALSGGRQQRLPRRQGAGRGHHAHRHPQDGGGRRRACPSTLGLDKLLVAVEEAGRVAVEKTTEQLPALQKAGVVDAGGYGLLVLFRGLAAGIAELMHAGIAVSLAQVALRTRRGRRGAAGAVRSKRASELSALPLLHEPAHHRRGPRHGRRSRRSCCRSGDSALVVGDRRMIKVHVHTNDPGLVLSDGAQARVRSARSRSTTCTSRPGARRAPAGREQRARRGHGRRGGRRRRGQQGALP